MHLRKVSALLLLMGSAWSPLAATDYGGDQSGNTLTAADRLFTFLANITGTFTVQGGDGYTLDFSALSVDLTIDLSITGSQTVASGLVITFQGFNTSGFYSLLYGGSGNDTFRGSAANDLFYSGSGDDQLYGGSGEDLLSGGDGNDQLYGGDDRDDLYGGSGDDILDAGANFDTLEGDAGNDILYGGTEADQLDGGDGDDLLNGGQGDDLISGSDGSDTFFDSSGNDMTVDLGTQTATGNGSDTLYNVENAQTGSGDDLLIGNGTSNTLNGGDGDDTLAGGGGDDTINSGLGSDAVDGGTGTDTQTGSAAECAGDTITSIEIDKCIVAPVVSVAPAAAPTPELCITSHTRVSVEGGSLLIFSDFGDHNPNGMIITQISLRSLRNPTDDEKAANATVPLTYKNSEFAPGWAAAVYWHANHYGVVVYKEGILFGDTGAICGWF